MKAILFLSATLLLSLSARGAGELPRRAHASVETYPKVDVIYDSVAGRAGERLRTIVTRPREAKGKLPVIFVAGWLVLPSCPDFAFFEWTSRELETAKAIVPKTISKRSWPGIAPRFVLWVNTTLSIPTRFTFWGSATAAVLPRWFQSRKRNGQG